MLNPSLGINSHYLYRRSFATDIHDETLQSFLRNNSFHEAMVFLTELSPQSPCIRDWKLQAYYRVCNAALLRHRSLVDTYNNSFRGITSVTEPTIAEPSQLNVLREIVQCAELAHNVLEKIEPFLGARGMWLDIPSAVNGSDVDDPFPEKLLMEADEVRNSIRDVSPSKEEDGLGSLSAFLNDREPAETKKEVDSELLKCCNDVLKAYALTIRAGYKGRASRTYVRAIPQRANFLLSRMELSLNDAHSTMTKSLPPSLLSYNVVLETWVYSREHLRGASAQRIFDKLASKKKKKKIAGAILPDGTTRRLILWAWALSRESRAAFTATGYLIKILKQLEASFDKNYSDDDFEGAVIEPTIEDYHIVLKAWTRSEERDSPGKAQFILKLMDRVYKKGVIMLQPDTICYRYVLETATNRPKRPDLGPLVDNTLQMMRDRFIVPDAKCYTAAIRTWKNAAVYQSDVSTKEQQISVSRTMELLSEMDVAHNQSTLVSISVSTENVNDVLEALTVSTLPSRVSVSEDLLSKLERQSNSPDESVAALKPTSESYVYALRILSSVASIEKIAKGKAILWRVKDNYALLRNRRVNSIPKRDPIVEIFNEFVKLCGSYSPQSNKEGLQVLGEALDSLRVMRSLGESADPKNGSYPSLAPNSVTYAALLSAVTKLLTLGVERRVSVENIFKLCCDDKMVDQNVLICLREAAYDEQFANLVDAHSETVEGTKVVPEAWTLNALGRKSIFADGRKATPLGVDGQFRKTRAMKEFQMRRILDNAKQKFLRGGRLRPRKHETIDPHWRLYKADWTMTSTE